MEKIENLLREIGLSPYKIQAYTALLRLRSGTIHQIAKNSNVPACKLYEVLKWLHINGYISLILQKPLTYKANDPIRILDDEVTKKQESLEKISSEIRNLKTFIPEIESDLIEITSSKLAFMKKMKDSLSKSKKSVSYIVGTWSIDNASLKLSKKKVSQGVNIRALGPINSKTKKRAEFSRKNDIKVKNFIPKNTRFSVFDKKTVIIKLRKQESDHISIWIKSEVLGEILEDYFNRLWKEAK
jgi:sugar-specific transcriptional regulator TrmB